MDFSAAKSSWEFWRNFQESPCIFSKKRLIISSREVVRVSAFCENVARWLIEVGGFAPHIDAVAYNHIKDVKHLTILLAVDKSTLNNGGLEVVDASHNMDIPLNVEDHCITDEWVDSHEWKPVELEPGECSSLTLNDYFTSSIWHFLTFSLGQLLIFTSYLAHRSGPNHSNENRKALYATYNLASEGDLHQDYYELRKKEWPATHMREEGESYEDGALRYAFGSPMLSVDAGRQLAF